MRPQKPKNRNRAISRVQKQQNRVTSYYLDDISCHYCINYRGKKRGCILTACDFEEEKLDAIKYGRIKRKCGEAV